MIDKPPFISSQRLLLLDKNVANPREFLRPEAFRTARLQSQQGGQGETADPNAKYWHEISDRSAFFCDPNLRRLCITTDAGIGKTTVLRWAQAEIMARDRRTLAIYIRLRDLPEKVAGYLALAGTSEATMHEHGGALVDIISEGRIHHAEGLWRAERLVDRAAAQGRLVLLVDALDEIGRTSQDSNAAPPRVKALDKFLKHVGRNCRVVIAGRPFAIDRFWDDLFDGDTWSFAQIDHFTEQEQEQYLGSDTYQWLGGLEILSVPRALQAIRSLEAEQLVDLRTASDVYHKCVESMLQKAASRELIREGFEDEMVLWLLGAMAFEMVLDGNFEGVPEGEFSDFRDQVWDRQQANSRFRDFDAFQDRLRQLGRTNEFLDHGFLEGRGMRQVFWRNCTLQEFFAGLWLARFASENDSRDMGEHLYLAHDDQTQDVYWVWRFAAEMPGAYRSRKRWARSMKPLYEPGDGTKEGTKRSSEMMYRVWAAVRLACARHEPGSKSLDTLYREELLTPYQTEFRDILAGRRGDSAKGIAEAFVQEFRRIPPHGRPEEPITFWMGSPESEVDRESTGMSETQREIALAGPFELACYTVTNEQYELFEPSHRDRGWDAIKVSHVISPREDEEARYPVVNVSWYDAWAFCCWLGTAYRLPTEAEWEFACRAARSTDPTESTAWCFGNDQDMLGQYAWYLVSLDNCDHRHAHAVGELKANAWGLYDMHGNVYEWTDSSYAEDPREASGSDDQTALSRLCRGGSWCLLPEWTRSADRGLVWHRSERFRFVGFRLARALHENL